MLTGAMLRQSLEMWDETGRKVAGGHLWVGRRVTEGWAFAARTDMGSWQQDVVPAVPK